MKVTHKIHCPVKGKFWSITISQPVQKPARQTNHSCKWHPHYQVTSWPWQKIHNLRFITAFCRNHPVMQNRDNFYTAEAHLYALFVHGITVIAFVIWVIVHAQLASCMQNHPICTCCLNCHLNYNILQLCACKYEQKKTHLINKALCTGFQSFLISQSTWGCFCWHLKK